MHDYIIRRKQNNIINKRNLLIRSTNESKYKMKLIQKNIPLDKKTKTSFVHSEKGDCELLVLNKTARGDDDSHFFKYWNNSLILGSDCVSRTVFSDISSHKIYKFTRKDNKPKRYGFDDQFSTYLRDVSNPNHKYNQL